MNTSSIISLKGPDRVRKRPSVIFGSDGVEGAFMAVKTLLDIFITEAMLDFSTNINVTIYKDNSLSIQSHDRGFILDETIIDGKPVWYNNFCELYCGPREPDEDYYFELGNKHNNLYETVGAPASPYQLHTDHAFDLCCVQYSSKFMHVEAVQNGIKKILDFKKGYSISDIIKEHTADNAHTFVHLLPDLEVFKDVTIPGAKINEFLKNTAMAIPGLKCELIDERDNTKYTHWYPCD